MVDANKQHSSVNSTEVRCTAPCRMLIRCCSGLVVLEKTVHVQYRSSRRREHQRVLRSVFVIKPTAHGRQIDANFAALFRLAAET